MGRPLGSGLLTLMQDSIGRLIPSEGLLGQVLVALGKALHLSQAGVEGHGWVVGVLGHVEVRGPPELLLNDQRLLQQLGVGQEAEHQPGAFSTSIRPGRGSQRKGERTRPHPEVQLNLTLATPWSLIQLGSLHLSASQWVLTRGQDPAPC